MTKHVCVIECSCCCFFFCFVLFWFAFFFFFFGGGGFHERRSMVVVLKYPGVSMNVEHDNLVTNHICESGEW